MKKIAPIPPIKHPTILIAFMTAIVVEFQKLNPAKEAQQMHKVIEKTNTNIPVYYVHHMLYVRSGQVHTCNNL